MRRGLSRMARPAAAGPSPLHRHQHLPSHPTPPSFPLSREPRAGARRGASPSPIAPPLPTEGAPPKSVRPEPVEGSPSPVIPHAASNPTPCAARHPDTATLRPHRCLRYRLPMVVANPHRNHNITAPHTVVCAVLYVRDMVHSDGQSRRVKQQNGWVPVCKKKIGLVAEMCQASYDSNTETSPRSHETSNPTPRAARHPDTASLPCRSDRRYRLPMVVANSHRNHNITAPHTVVCAGLNAGRMVHSDGQRRRIQQQEGWVPVLQKRLDL